MPHLKLVYFGMPGRGEPVRLMSAIGGLDLEDQRLAGPEWGALKPSVAPMQLPLLYVDGKLYGQSLAQQRYVAKLTGLYPSDPLEALQVDEMVDYVHETYPALMKSFEMTDIPERDAYRAKCVAAGGDTHKWLQFIDTRLAGKTFAVGSSLTWADISIFTMLQVFKAGWLDGVPKTCLDSFANIGAHATRIANLEKVKAHYADATGVAAVFKA